MHPAIKKLLNQPVVVETYGAFKVVREDLVSGGAKMRFLPYVVQGWDEVVFGGPYCGGAPLALSELGKRSGQQITLFYAARKELHPRQIKAKANGAKIVTVRPGYMTVVQARARAYAAGKKALFLELGFDVPLAQEPFLRFLQGQVGADPLIRAAPEIWCATGSGMLARCLALAFPQKQIQAVAVGLKSRHSAQQFPDNVVLRDSPYVFSRECRVDVPYTSCPNYDRKAYEAMRENGKPGAVHYNVL